MIAVMIGYACIFLCYIIYQVAIIVWFHNRKKALSAVHLMDRAYVSMLILVAVIYLSGSIEATVEVLSDIQRYSNGRLPFAIYALPLITGSFRLALSDGLYAYGNGYLIGYKTVAPIETITIKRVTVSKRQRVKAVLSIRDRTKAGTKDIIMRASKKRFDVFVEAVGLR